MKKNNTSLYLAAIFAVALLIGVGYAALSATLKINGQTTINKASWDVHFENVATNDSTAIKFYAANDTSFSSALTNIASLSGTTLNYSVNLSKPDATAQTTHDMSVDVVNKGTIDATISSVTLPSMSSDIGGHTAVLTLTKTKCTYSDGTEIKTGDILKAGASKTITCKHHFKSPSELDLDGNGQIHGWGGYSSSVQSATANFSLILNFTAK